MLVLYLKFAENIYKYTIPIVCNKHNKISKINFVKFVFNIVHTYIPYYYFVFLCILTIAYNFIKETTYIVYYFFFNIFFFNLYNLIYISNI